MHSAWLNISYEREKEQSEKYSKFSWHSHMTEFTNQTVVWVSHICPGTVCVLRLYLTNSCWWLRLTRPQLPPWWWLCICEAVRLGDHSEINQPRYTTCACYIKQFPKSGLSFQTNTGNSVFFIQEEYKSLHSIWTVPINDQRLPTTKENCKLRWT